MYFFASLLTLMYVGVFTFDVVDQDFDLFLNRAKRQTNTNDVPTTDSLSEDERSLFYLFEKPSEPIYLPKPMKDSAIVFSTPDVEVPIDFTGLRFGDGPPPVVTTIRKPPTADQVVEGVKHIKRGDVFSPFIKSHRDAAKIIVDAFMSCEDATELKNLAGSVRDYVNETLFVYALSYTILHRKELRKITLPPIYEIFPGRFIPEETIQEANEQVAFRQHQLEPSPTIEVNFTLDFTGTDLNPEHRVAYWREDYGINAHHWHWHLIYPIGLGIPRDRKGELFYFMHQQMLARYDMERLSNGLNRVTSLDNWRIPIPEGYFSKLTLSNGRNWGTRQDATFIRDYARAAFAPITVSDLENYRTQILEAIDLGRMVDRNGQQIRLTDIANELGPGQKSGIEIIGDTIESDGELSANFQLYGDLHNLGHVVIAFSHDPDGTHQEQVGVMGDPGTAMRDPVFYRWHKFIDETFQRYKTNQRPYTEQELSFPGITIENVGISTGNSAGTLFTGFRDRIIDATRGLTFADNSVPIRVRITHLDHRPFKYHIKVHNYHSTTKSATVRIFMAPKFNAGGREMNFNEQRLLWTEMDKFFVNLKPGPNQMARMSTRSSVTIPDEYTFRELETGRVVDFSAETGEPISRADYCGCGWPQHMLIPRGRPDGMAFELFVLLTNYEEDQVEKTGGSRSECKAAHSFCGILDEKYPDKRPMGYPFDRQNSQSIQNRPFNNAADLARLDNAFIHDFSIRFLGANVL